MKRIQVYVSVKNEPIYDRLMAFVSRSDSVSDIIWKAVENYLDKEKK